ncbi:MAG: MarR family winged helix-turn-helix transcriptional regulator [Gammaproteobacteria bacterium]|nr:MarR family winged helix-turn-helix transcriptional regulator [Gammaproteobacteria bacterium]
MNKAIANTDQKTQLNGQAGHPKQLLDMDTSVLSQVHFAGNRIQLTGSTGYKKWYDISISEFRLLVVISNEPGSTGARVNEIMGLDLGAISRSLRKMEKRGLVYSTVHPKHPSYRCWYITKVGAELHDRVYEMTKIREAAILKGFSKAESHQLLSYLHRISENAEVLVEIAEQGAVEFRACSKI